MSDPYKKETPDSLDDVKGEPREQTGKPEDERVKRRGDVDQSDNAAKDVRSDRSASRQAEEEQKRQLKSGQENPG